MTTIAYRNGILAADTRISFGDCTLGNTSKLYAIDGYCVGASGERSEIEPFLEWVRAGADISNRPKFPDDPKAGFSAIVAHKNMSPKIWYIWTSDRGTMIVDEVEAEYLACGSGKYFAMGAMAHGACATECILAAMKCDHWTGGKVDVLVVADA